MSGLTVIPGVIDSDYEGEIKIIVQLPTKTFQIKAGQRIAQLLLLPYIDVANKVAQDKRGTGGFASTDLAFWVQEIKQKRSPKIIKVQGVPIEGLLDTGADVSCIAGKD